MFNVLEKIVVDKCYEIEERKCVFLFFLFKDEFVFF